MTGAESGLSSEVRTEVSLAREKKRRSRKQVRQHEHRCVSCLCMLRERSGRVYPQLLGWLSQKIRLWKLLLSYLHVISLEIFTMSWNYFH